MSNIFQCYSIGGKRPVYDIIIQKIDEAHPYHTLVQVKSTEASDPYDERGNMKTPVPEEKLQKLISRTLPT